MKLGINATFLNETPTGVGVFTREVSRRLCALNAETRVFTPVRISAVEEKFVIQTPAWMTGSVRFSYNFRRFVYSNTVLPLLLKRERIQLFYCPIMEFPFTASTPLVVTVMDLHPVYFPRQFGLAALHFRFSLLLLARLARRIVCPSRFVKGELIRRLGLRENLIDVVPLACDTDLFTPQGEEGKRAFLETYRITRPYILFVGSLFPYKNVRTLTDAFLEIKELIPHRLLIVGKKEVSPAPPVEDERIVYLDYVDGRDMARFYSHADMLVHPSFTEGFGMTVLEAMACGTPVISSRGGSLPEVLGDAGTLFDPCDSSALAKAILDVALNEGRRREMSERGLQRAKGFSWNSTARAILSSCNEALSRDAA